MSQDPATDGPNPFSREGAGAYDGLGTGPVGGDRAADQGPSDESGSAPDPGSGHGEPAAAPPPYLHLPPSAEPSPPGEPARSPERADPDRWSADPPYAEPPWTQPPWTQPPCTGPGAPLSDPPAHDPYAGGFPVVYAGPYAGGYLPQPHPQAATALVLGLVGLIVCWPLGIAGLVVGTGVRRDCDANPGRYSGRAMGTAGVVLGILSILALVGWVGVFLLLGLSY